MLKFLLVFLVVIVSVTGTTSPIETMIETTSSNADSWFYKFSFTKNVNSQVSIECSNSDQIWIGWSHYGTRNPTTVNSEPTLTKLAELPNELDCWMNFTEKIAEQCNGADRCDLSSQPTYIHKCGKISDYLYVAYKCIRERDTFDICRKTEPRVFSLAHDSFYIKSSEFPDEYSSSLDCSCLLTQSSQVHQAIKLEVLWFSLQDNDVLSIGHTAANSHNSAVKNLTGWINPTYEMPLYVFEFHFYSLR
jgi:hypothetical protein